MDHKIIFVSLNVSYPAFKKGAGRENLYECTRKYWRVNKKKALEADYIAGVFKGNVISFYKIKKDSWKLVKEQPLLLKEKDVLEHPKYESRYSVESENGEKEAVELKNKYPTFRLYGSVGYNY